MDDVISRQAAIDALNQQAETMRGWSERYAEQRKGILTAVNIVEDLLPAQPERIRGRWTRDNACSECGCQPWFSGDIHNYNFCPNCGAKMKGGA